MAVSLGFLPTELRKALMPFQKKGIRYGIEKEGRCLIGDEMGLGKTLQALSIAYYFKDDWPLLIIVPSTMKYPWVDEIEKWIPKIPPEDINIVKNCSDVTSLRNAKISIISYGLISLRNNLNASLLQTIQNAKFGVTIVDESHYLKNRQSSRTKKILKLLKGMKRVILLTGTPSLARPEELFSQINIIQPGIVGNWQYYGQRYCDGRMIVQPARGGRMFHKFDTRGASNLKELHEILKNNLMIRRLKKDVLTELPAKRRQRIRFEITTDSDRKKNLEKSLTAFKEVVTKIKSQLHEKRDEELATSSDVNFALTNLFRDTGLAKAGAIQEYISDLIEGMPNKFIVFCYHRAVIDAVTELLAKRNVKYVRIAGDVPPEVRASYVREFQSEPTCRVAVLSITASCLGITLTAADHVVFAELHWTPGVIKQAEDRCHRIGQKNAVQIHFLIARGTMDDVMWSMLSRKLTVTGETLDGQAQILSADDEDQGKADLLSMCQAWVPNEDDDEDMYLFTQKSTKKDLGNQRDIRSCFAESSQDTRKKKRKTRNYYEKGFVNISDSSDDNSEFKAQHMRSKKRKKDNLRKSEESSGNRRSEIAIIDLESDITCNNKCNDKAVPVAVSSYAKENKKANIASKFEPEEPCLIREIPKLREVMQTEHDLSSVCMPALREVLHCSPQTSNEVEIEKDLEENVGRRDEHLLEGLRTTTFTSVAKMTITSEKVARTCLNSVIPTINSCTFDDSLGVRPLDMNKTDKTSCSETKKTFTAAEVGSEQHNSSAICSNETCSPRITFEVPGLSVGKTRHEDLRHVNLDAAKIKACIETRDNIANDTNEARGFLSKNDPSKKHVDLAAPGRNIDISTSQNEIQVIDLESEANASWSCIACTFHNHQDLSRCEMCETERPKHFTRLIRKTHGFDTDSLASSGELEIIEISKRKGGKGKTSKRGKDTGLTDRDKIYFEEHSATGGNSDAGKSDENFVIDESSLESGSWESVDEEVDSARMTDALLVNKKRTEPQVELIASEKESSAGLLLDIDMIMPNQTRDSLNKSFTRTDCTLTDSSTDIENDWNENLGKVRLNADVSMQEECNVPGREDENSSGNSLVASSCISSTSSLGTIDKRVLLTNRPLEIAASNHSQDSNKTKLTTECNMKSSQQMLNVETNRKHTLSPVRTTHRHSFFSSPLLFSSPEQHFASKTVTGSVENGHGFKTASQIFAEQRDEYLDGSDDDALLEALYSVSEPENIVQSVLSDENGDSLLCGSEMNDSQRSVLSSNDSESASLKPEDCSFKPMELSSVNENQETSQNPSEQKSELNFDIETTKAANDEINDDMDFLTCDFDDDISLIASEKSEYSTEEEEEILPTELFFKLSFESDRIYLYDEEEEPLGINFRLPELGPLDTEELPKIFQHPYNMKQLKKLIREWHSLTSTKQRMVRKAGYVFKSPVQVYDELREARYGGPSKERFTSKEDRNKKVKTIAEMIGGSVAEIKGKGTRQKDGKFGKDKDENGSKKDHEGSARESSKTANTKLLQAVDPDGNPVCLFCNAPVINGFKAGTMEARFCSYTCEEEYRFRTTRSKAVRGNLFSVDKGICQMCNFNSHELFQRVSALRKKDRRAVLEQTHFISLPASLLNKMITDPKEGQFWEADHINAVSEGGGECGLDNYRTLCVPCHKKVTKDLNIRLGQQRKLARARAEGNADIERYFVTCKEKRQEILMNDGRVEPVRQDLGKSSSQTSIASIHKTSPQNAAAQMKHDASQQGITKNASAKAGEVVIGSRGSVQPLVRASSKVSRHQDSAKESLHTSGTGALRCKRADISSTADMTSKNSVTAPIVGDAGKCLVIAASSNGPVRTAVEANKGSSSMAEASKMYSMKDRHERALKAAAMRIKCTYDVAKSDTAHCVESSSNPVTDKSSFGGSGQDVNNVTAIIKKDAANKVNAGKSTVSNESASTSFGLSAAAAECRELSKMGSSSFVKKTDTVGVGSVSRTSSSHARPCSNIQPAAVDASPVVKSVSSTKKSASSGTNLGTGAGTQRKGQAQHCNVTTTLTSAKTSHYSGAACSRTAKTSAKTHSKGPTQNRGVGAAKDLISHKAVNSSSTARRTSTVTSAKSQKKEPAKKTKVTETLKSPKPVYNSDTHGRGNAGIHEKEPTRNDDTSGNLTSPKPRHYSSLDMKDADKLIANLISMSAEKHR